ncbi:allophanate hydrolase-related protein [Amycolatopsis methanolica]|uniref:Allophanate hydrolase C-terminal domain-containing protein n=1 Tax=Amycolatopsis methanolica 239 TaxID=1068978 RepID=A0A076N2A5_AMYME|nr:hypothetical protein [Amycolatopsis methanolica]AIJ24057.1 hypothetical protein AMETH_3965 [Amycolatopsis methanolica 239]
MTGTITDAGHRMYTVDGPFPRPGLLHTGDGPVDGIELEVWDLPEAAIGALLPTIAPPPAPGPVDARRRVHRARFRGRHLVRGPRQGHHAYGGRRAYLSS